MALIDPVIQREGNHACTHMVQLHSFARFHHAALERSQISVAVLFTPMWKEDGSPRLICT